MKEATVLAPPRRSDRIAAAMAEGGGGEASEDEDANYADAAVAPPGTKPPCPRSGGAARKRQVTRKQIAATVTAMREELERELDGDGEGKKKKGASRHKTKTKDGAKKSDVVWNINGEPPNATWEAALRIVQLGMIPISPTLQSTLTTLLFELQPPSAEPSSPACTSTTSPASVLSPFAAALTNCAQLEARSILTDFELMMSYIRAAFYIQW